MSSLWLWYGCYLKQGSLFFIKVGWRQGTSTKAELMSVWGLLQFASIIGILDINIYGDSKVIIEWLKENYNLRVLLIN